jgi:transposase-like protein
MAFTKEQEKEYLSRRGTRCPYCKGTDISSDHSDIATGGPDELFPKVTCDDCGKTWIEQYQLVGIQESE